VFHEISFSSIVVGFFFFIRLGNVMTFVGTDGSTEAVVVIWIKNRWSPMVRSLHSDLVQSTCAPVVPAVVPAPGFVERVDMGQE